MTSKLGMLNYESRSLPIFHKLYIEYRSFYIYIIGYKVRYININNWTCFSFFCYKIISPKFNEMASLVTVLCPCKNREKHFFALENIKEICVSANYALKPAGNSYYPMSIYIS